MAAKSPRVGQLAFKGNIVRAMRKIISGTKSIKIFLKTHPGWPVILLNKVDLTRLETIASILDAERTFRVPAPKPQ